MALVSQRLAFLSLDDSQANGEDEKGDRKGASSLLQDIGGLGAEGILHHAGGKRGTQPFLLGPLHQDDQHQEDADQHMKEQENGE